MTKYYIALAQFDKGLEEEIANGTLKECLEAIKKENTYRSYIVRFTNKEESENSPELGTIVKTKGW